MQHLLRLYYTFGIPHIYLLYDMTQNIITYVGLHTFQITKQNSMSNRAEKDAVRWCHLTHQVFAGGDQFIAVNTKLVW